MASDRHYAVLSKLTHYTRSPSLRHIRDPHQLGKLAEEIVQAIDQANSIWRKWDGPREEVAKAAALCWIPIEDLQAFLNDLPGPTLTATDVAQRLRAIWEEPYNTYPKEELKAGCLEVYAEERALGTEMMAIIGALQEHIELEEERLRREQEERYRRYREEELERLEQRFRIGADCGWTRLGGSKDYYCRRNGRAFRIEQGKDKRWCLYRIKSVDDEGVQVGTYLGRGDANKVIKQVAYEPEPRW